MQYHKRRLIILRLHFSCLKHGNYLQETKNQKVMSKYYLEHKEAPCICFKGQKKISEYAAFTQSLGNQFPINKLQHLKHCASNRLHFGILKTTYKSLQSASITDKNCHTAADLIEKVIFQPYHKLCQSKHLRDNLGTATNCQTASMENEFRKTAFRNV
jgi:hypothetical protein